MPLYEFTCVKCRHDFEELVPTPARDSGVVCPKCGAAHPDRRFSVFSARSGASQPAAQAKVPTGGCGRCGDPAGPCGL